MNSPSCNPSTFRTPSLRDINNDDDNDDNDESSAVHSSPPRSPSYLVLVQDPEDLPELELWQSDCEDLENAQRRDDIIGHDGLSTPRSPGDVLSASGVSVMQIVTLLIAPTLKLGATQLLNQSLQRHSVLPVSTFAAAVWLILAGALNALAVQIYLMLGVYVRRWTIEGVVGEAFVGFTGQRAAGSRTPTSPWKKVVVRVTKAMIVLGGSLLCAAYLRESTDLLVPLVPKSSYTFERVGVAAGLGLLICPFLAKGTKLTSRRIVYSNMISIALYVIVAIVIIVHRFQDDGGEFGGERESERGLHVRRGRIKVHLTGGAWEWLDFALFAFTTQFFTFPLFAPYAQGVAAQNARKEAQSRRAISSPMSPTTTPSKYKKPKRKAPPTFRFFSLAVVASMISIVLVAMPLFLGRSRGPSNVVPPKNPALRALTPYIERTFNALRILQAIYLVLGIPPIWVATITPRVYSTNISLRWVQDIQWHWVLFVSLISLASFAPNSLAHFISRSAGLSLIGFSFVLPALLHVTVHTVRSPLSIILPSGDNTMDDGDMLLRRKERSLQRKRWLRRAGWDLGVWIVLGPVALVSWFWWLGRTVGFW